ncbi:amidohydrolase family protein [Pseudozobellia thermophila]|uniref:Imidazolonepropionase n=1 Tax=Pseudozobellia thermophila TaxID=192903 RepID=A0A1M6J0V5_9FLAO|nr:amidohydrolase family protein [Pseudozobellia thermophila]SHJ40271.1 Imidazolonepropionase [Pseudozobellia thermophila]
MKIQAFISALFLSLMAVGQQTPAPPQTEAITIEGATAHLGNGELIENSLIMFEGGKLTFVGSAMTKIARRGKTIRAQGKHVYPGLIAPSTSLGLVEIDAVRATKDQDELGEMIPHIRSLIAYNAESKVVESMRPNGVLLGQITPKGGRISGTSSIVQFDAWNWEDAAVKVDDGIHLHWPESFQRGKPNKKYGEQVSEVKDFFKDAAAYGKVRAQEVNPVFAAMQGVFEGTKKLYVYANGEKEILDGIRITKGLGAKEVVLVGGYRAHKLIDFLKGNDIPVLVRHTHKLPFYDDEDYDQPYKLPKLLMEGGLLVGMQNSETSNFQTRNLPFFAGQTVAHGLNREEALQLISGNTAQILGIADNYGTLEQGKSATLFISEGDALDMRGNRLTHAFIDGREISLDTHQTELWKRYSKKYEGEMEGK